MTTQTEPESRRGAPSQRMPVAVLAFLGVALVFVLAVTAFVAFRHDQASLFFLALTASSTALTLGRLLPTRRS